MKKLLGLSLFALSISLYADPTQMLSQRLNAINSMTSVLNQMTQGGSQEPTMIDANISIQRPNQLNMQVTNSSPKNNNRTLYISNGTTLWTIPKGKSATTTQLQNNLNDLVALPALIAAEPISFISNNFNIQQIGKEGTAFTLTPKASNSPVQQIQYFFNADGSALYMIAINYSSGTQDTLNFYQVKNNVSLDPKLFTYPNN